MSIFNPRTYSTDWEIMVIDRLNRSIDTAQCASFAGALSSEFDWAIIPDWRTIELCLGINTSLEGMYERICKTTDRAGEFFNNYDLQMFPSGAHPVERMFNSSHIHVGTIHDEKEAIYLENQVMKYLPAFAALAANSPFWQLKGKEFKSYRVMHKAHDCTRPMTIRDPHFSQPMWGMDACPKIYSKPTLEIRIIDCASSRRFLAEMTTFVAAFLHHLGEKVSKEMPSKKEYQDFLTNRWAAAKFGMQASFIWGSKGKSVAEILDGMIDECESSLKHLGAKKKDLVMINKMIKKRICQADFGLNLAERYSDPYVFADVFSKLLRNWNAIDEFIDSAKSLEPKSILDEKAIIDQHLRLIGDETHFYRLRDAMHYPGTLTDEIIEKLLKDGLITKEETKSRGTLLHRK